MNPPQVVATPTSWLAVDRSSQVHGCYFGQQIKVPVWSTAMVGADKKIVVDTGIHDPAWVSVRAGAGGAARTRAEGIRGLERR
ncbi:hypothetical protein R69776_01634 [Paraburkholderia nemoris]|uniref:Uncharacterized protein n=1 Tax=Paraburkholderia nemoris TaxID=2793076 RepID=A0ABM8QYG0_9BURK|nr:hypothetical protein R69776_01634 [Paraburkholderia nemoris]CAE6749819.1 hypothetical protein R75777_02935 [Paraburkholderia nemoris]